MNYEHNGSARGGGMSNVKNINSAAEIRASDAAVIKFIDNLIQCATDVINEKGDISVTYSELIKYFTEIKDNRISKSNEGGK